MYTTGHPLLTSPFPFQEPLLNFIHFFISAIDKRSPQLVKLLKDKYKKSLDRDPCFDEVCYFKTCRFFICLSAVVLLHFCSIKANKSFPSFMIYNEILSYFQCINKILWVYFKESNSPDPSMGGLGKRPISPCNFIKLKYVGNT